MKVVYDHMTKLTAMYKETEMLLLGVQKIVGEKSVPDHQKIEFIKVLVGKDK